MKIFHKTGIFDEGKPNTPENCKSTYPGKFKQQSAPRQPSKQELHLAKLKQAEARLEADDYVIQKNGHRIKDHASMKADIASVKELNLINAKAAHESAGASLGAWITEKKASADYSLLGTTLQRLANAGHILIHKENRTYSTASIEAYLSKTA
jgi:hypothetical protein